MGADYSFYVKFIGTYAPAFLGYNNSVLARVDRQAVVHLCIGMPKGYQMVLTLDLEDEKFTYFLNNIKQK